MLPPSRRRNGKVARLPKEIRDQINLLIRDGATYPAIIQHLVESKAIPDANALSEHNLSRWHYGGYQDWLESQHWLEAMQNKLEFATNILENGQDGKMHEASLSIAVKQMYDLLSKFDPLVLEEKLCEDPANYARVLNALSKLTEAALKYQRERTEKAVGQLAPRRPRPAKGALGISPETLRQIEHELRLL